MAPGMQAYLGVTPPNDRDGCLQDVHWYFGSIGGGFKSYTIGFCSFQFGRASAPTSVLTITASSSVTI